MHYEFLKIQTRNRHMSHNFQIISYKKCLFDDIKDWDCRFSLLAAVYNMAMENLAPQISSSTLNLIVSKASCKNKIYWLEANVNRQQERYITRESKNAFLSSRDLSWLIVVSIDFDVHHRPLFFCVYYLRGIVYNWPKI